MGGGGILCEGWLVKSPPLKKKSVKRWKRRWFVLRQSNILEYYEERSSKEPKGKINLEDCTSIGTNLALKKGKYMFDVETPGRVYYFCADSQSELDRWVAALCERCHFQTSVGSPAGTSFSRGTTLPQRPASESVSVVRGIDTLPSVAHSRERRAQTYDALSPVEDNERPGGTGEYCLAGEVTNGTLSGSSSSGVYSESVGLQSGILPAESTSESSTSTHGRSMTSYDIVPPARPSRSSTMPLEAAFAEMSPSDRYVPLPTAMPPDAQGVNPVPSKGRQPYQYPPAPRPYLPGVNAVPAAAPEELADGPTAFYSYPPAPRPVLPPKSSFDQSPPTTTEAPSQYASLQPSPPPPEIDRSSKPRRSTDGTIDPNAPPIDRGSKPLPMRVSPSLQTLDGAEFDHLPVATDQSKRFSRLGCHTIPPTATPLTVELATELYNRPPPMTVDGQPISPDNPPHLGPMGNYDYPPGAVNALMHLQLQPFAVPPPPPPDDDPMAAYDYPPPAQGHISPEQQPRPLSTIRPNRPGSYRHPDTNYSYPPPPIHRNSVQSGIGPDGAYDYPPPARQSISGPPGQNQLLLANMNETELAYTDMRNGVMGEYYTHMDQNGAIVAAGDDYYSAVPKEVQAALAPSVGSPGHYPGNLGVPRPALPPKPR